MSNYTKSTNFASKDSLSAGDPLKIVKGTEINTEFDNIATAVATKADLASPTLTGTPAAPTASVGTNTTQLATTALVFAAMQALYPVGTLYSNISVSTNPATLFGFGTWVAITGRVVVGLDSGDAAFDTVGETGGSKDAIVVAHTHSITDPTHTHGMTVWNNGTGLSDFNYLAVYTSSGGGSSGTLNAAISGPQAASTGITGTNSTGSSGTNANLPPYVVAYVWKRVS